LNISNKLSAAIFNHVLRNVPYTAPTTIYLALYKSDPTPADTGSEVTGGSYVRIPITFAAPTLEGGNQTVKNAADIEFPTATADWGLVTHIGLRSALTGGDLLWSKAVDNPRTIQTGDKPRFLKDGTSVKFTN
jgi:hypothetical protein